MPCVIFQIFMLCCAHLHVLLCLSDPQARTEAAARAVLEAAKKAGAAGELLGQRDLQAIFQQAMNPRKEAPAKVCWAFMLLFTCPCIEKHPAAGEQAMDHVRRHHHTRN
jgi:hypothetical protein